LSYLPDSDRVSSGPGVSERRVAKFRKLNTEA
jgi:hypothetical protein